MYDYFFKWADEAAAKADVLMLADYLDVSGGEVKVWLSDRTLVNPQVWRPSQDAMVGSPAVLTHTYLTGWFAIIAINRKVNLLLNSAALQFCLDRDARNAGQPFVIKNNIGTVINDIKVSPVFAGSNY